MSKIPIEKHGQTCSKETRGIFYNAPKKTIKSPSATSIKSSAGDSEPTSTSDINKIKTQRLYRSYASLIPKMKEEMQVVNKQNPRILDLRLKLNEISKKQDLYVDKQTKGLINGITQQLVDEKEQLDSGPYSLLFDLQSIPSTSCNEKEPSKAEDDITNMKCHRSLDDHLNKIVDRLPSVIHFEDKAMKEFEYSCEVESNNQVKKFNTQSRSELCLHFKSHAYNKMIDQSPHSISRPNDEHSLDDSLGILTPDQMDDMCFLDNEFSPTVEGLPVLCNADSKASPETGDTPSTEKTESHSGASTIQNDAFECNESKSLIPTVNVEEVEASLKDNKERMTCVVEGSDISDIHSVKEGVPEKRHSDPVLDGIMDEDFMPSIHSSILEPVSSIAETTVNLDLPLDCKLNCPTPQRIEQTPSPEDLPLDSCETLGEISTCSNSQYTASALHDSQTYSETKTDFVKSMETSKVSNSFITSITSITSLDGYQGDGEMSRPVSRAADHSIREEVMEMDWQNVPVTRRVDPMTDSDFFTESDADGHEDHVHRGDRRAQVIDGALYGGKNGNNPPLIVNRNDDSCMESSGVYTDFDNHRASPIFLNVIDDMSPNESTPSTRSECSQKNMVVCADSGFSPALDSTLQNNSNVDVETPKNMSKRSSLCSEKSVKSMEKKDEKRCFTLKKYKMPKRDVPSKLKTMLTSRKVDTDASNQSSPKIMKKSDRRENTKKITEKNDYRPKQLKDIKSKVDSSFSLQRSQTTCSVTRMVPVKTPSTVQKPKSRHLRMRMELGSAGGSGKSSLHSSQSDISATSTPLGKAANRFPLLRNGKKRDSIPAATTPARAPSTPPHPPTAQAKKNGVVPTKLASSPVVARGRTSLVAPPSPRKPAQRRLPATRPNTLPTNNKEPPRVTAAVGPRGKRVQTPQPAARTPAQLAAPLVAPLAAPPVAGAGQAAALAHASKGVEALGVLVQYLVFRLDALNGDTWRAEAERWRGVAAAERSSAARADADRQMRAQKDLDTIAECLSKISELEMEVAAKEEANARLQASHVEEVSALAADIKDLKETIEALKQEVSESRARLHAHSEQERTLRAQLEAARCDVTAAQSQVAEITCPPPPPTAEQQCDRKCETCDAACDPVCCESEIEIRLNTTAELSSDANELAAEVRSLRAVVELKQAEVASLRGARSELAVERERRIAAERDARSARHAAEELKERAASRQTDVDRLREDNRRLRETAARDRDHASRIAALNEELRYKLRQKSQVVSLLAGSTYGNRSPSPPPPPPSPPTSSGSPTAGSPSHPAHPAGDSPQLPAVKGVVEKHDSVSWVLEIEETPEEVASRLARRSSFRAPPSPAAGVKRRPSPPAPASPPAAANHSPHPSHPSHPSHPPHAAHKLFRHGELKESAGEAIYIYSDARY